MKYLFFVVLITAWLNILSKAIEKEKNIQKIADQFAEFKRKFNRKYASKDEDTKRFEIFQKNVEKITQINAKNLPYDTLRHRPRGTTSSTRCEVICGQCICLWAYVTNSYFILKISTSLKLSSFLFNTSRAKEVKLTIL